VDPVSHALLGRTLGVLDRGERLTRGAAAAAIVGALAPDLDIVMAARGWDVYLLTHESWTHTLTASPLIALAVAAAVRLAWRDTPLLTLWRIAWLGVVVGHVGFDVISGSDIRLFLPWSERRIGPHLFAMADALLVPIVLAGTAALAWRQRLGMRARTIAALVLAIIVVLSAVKAASQRAAVDRVARAAAEERPSSMSAPFAVNGSMTQWRFYQQAGDEVRAWRVDVRTGEAALAFRWPSNRDDPAIIASMHAPVVRALRELAVAPFARVQRSAAGSEVAWSDLPFCDANACTLWFGVRIDASGHPIDQFVRIGGYEQRRDWRP
jgi:membrane-bound metal-dependent hydrolase YbcI (DUF457 family)